MRVLLNVAMYQIFLYVDFLALCSQVFVNVKQDGLAHIVTKVSCTSNRGCCMNTKIMRTGISGRRNLRLYMLHPKSCSYQLLNPNLAINACPLCVFV